MAPMANSKYIFFDIDGTLWDSKMQIPASTKQALELAKKAGHKIFICTGRSRGNVVSPTLHALGFSGILAACGTHVEMDGQVLFEKTLSAEELADIIETTKKYGMPIVLEGPDKLWITEDAFADDPYVDYLYETLGEKARPLRGYEPDMVVNKFSADILPETNYPAIREKLSAYTFLEHDGIVVEMVPRGFSKATGIQWLCTYLGVPIEDTYALGDSVNDLDMLESVGHGIAMGNGSPEAKAAAEYVTTSIHEDGVYNALKHYGLI